MKNWPNEYLPHALLCLACARLVALRSMCVSPSRIRRHYRRMYGREALTREEHPELREAANALFEQFVGVIQAHQRSGALKRQDPRAQAYVAWSAVHGLASLWIEGPIQATDDSGDSH